MGLHDKSDYAEIERLLEESLRQISWDDASEPDWESFFASYLETAMLIPSERPARCVTPRDFRLTMDEQRLTGKLVSLEERPVKTFIRIFGNVAIAQVAFGAKVNSGPEKYGVNAFLLVKSGGGWKVAAVAWDNASDELPLPDDLK